MSTSLSFDKMYKLRDPLGNRALRLTAHDDFDWLTNDIAGSLFSGQLVVPPQSLLLHGYMGGQPMDFLWSGMTPIVCVSERVIKLLAMHNLTGWSTYPVEVYDRTGDLLPNYHGFSITGRVGQRDRSQSQILDVPLYKGSEKTHKVYKGFFFDKSSWDGSDFCTTVGTYYKIVTKAAFDVLKQNKVNNIRLTRLTDVEIPVSLDKFSTQT